MVKSLCIRVPPEHAEKERRKLTADGVIDPDLKIKREKGFVLIPIIKKIYSEYLWESDFEPIETRKSYKEIAEVPDAFRGLLPTAFDIIGDIAVIKLEDEIIEYAEKIGEAIIKANRHIKTVCLDRGVSGDFRIRNLEVISGEKRTETVHTEYGCRIKIDLKKAYFSPRLATERYRVAKSIADGETVIDMFAGVGPFSIAIARHARPSKIYAIDINPEAFEYLKENIRINRVEDIVQPLCGDAGEVMRRLPKAERILMNLPHSSCEFLEDALRAVKDNGTINYYEIWNKDDMEKRVEQLKDMAKDMGYQAEAGYIRIVHPYSPARAYFSVEFRIQQML